MIFQSKQLRKHAESLRRELKRESNNTIDSVAIRTKAIDNLENGDGALLFIEDLKRYATNEKGEKLRIRPWFEEYARLGADVRIAEVYISGVAQCGKSLLGGLLQAWLVIECKLNILYAFAQERALNRMIPIQMRPLIDHWLKNKGEKLERGTRNNTLLQINGGTAIYSYVSTTKPKGGGAAAGSSIVSFSVDLAFCDERSQYPPGAADPVYRRLDAGRISTHPIRLIGTPGAGMGIEDEISKADYHFYPHAVCPHCNRQATLHPFGALLKATEKQNAAGQSEVRYLSESGKPDDWFHKDPNDPVGSAYFACEHCEGELDQESRINAYFVCLNTDVKLIEFLNNFDNPNGKRYKAGIVLSPLLRESKLNLAAEIIQSGLDSANSADWQQQRLGLPSQGEDASLTIDQIKRAIYAPEPLINKRQERIVLGGCDQGRSNDFICITEFILPLDQARMSVEETLSNTVRNVLFAGAIMRSEIPDKLKQYDCISGVIDNEPNITTAAELARDIGWQLADQKPKQKDAVKPILVRDGGEEFDCWGIRNSRFLKAVKNIFITNYEDGYPLVRLPMGWEKWVYSPTEVSPVRHLSSISYDSATGLFVRPQDHNDDIYYAFAFAEVALYLHLTGQGAYPAWIGLT